MQTILVLLILAMLHTIWSVIRYIYRENYKNDLDERFRSYRIYFLTLISWVSLIFGVVNFFDELKIFLMNILLP